MKFVDNHTLIVMPAKAGIQLDAVSRVTQLDSRLRGNDGLVGVPALNKELMETSS